jgi:hypothetical protein
MLVRTPDSATFWLMRPTPLALFSLIPLIGLMMPSAPASDTGTNAPIDRQALVSRHDVTMHEADPMGTLAVGNGDIAFNVDVTGLQSFPEYYDKTLPLGILSDWGWHHFPNPEGYTLEKYPMKTIPKNGRKFVYPTSGTNHPSPEAAYLRSNPQRIGLGRIGLEMTHADGTPVTLSDIKGIDQHLDLWGGILTSSFTVDGIPVKVLTVSHPDKDELAASVESPLVSSGHLKIRIAFPYASHSFGPDYQDWTHPELHKTVMKLRGQDGADFSRTLDDTHYAVRMKWSDGATLSKTAPHNYLLTGKGDRLDVSAWFSPEKITAEADGIDAVTTASRDHWKDYWTKGGVLDLSGNSDPRAAELERRIVLSQYLMAVNDAGSHPPEETGLGANSWFGKFHMEMYWWHAAHWALWGHPELLEKSLSQLNKMMPPGEAMAAREGCHGVKWSKMTDPSGEESPSGVGPVLVWQQPPPIFLAELVWRARRDQATLEKYKDIVFKTADYMADFVDYDPVRKAYVLGPGVSSADEKHTDVEHNLNPTMELGYWKWALQIAQEWRLRLGLPRKEAWDKVINGLSPLTARDGVYPALELPEEHKPSVMTTFLLGALPGPGVDREVMRNTLHAVNTTNALQTNVTWGTGMMAMCAARLDEPERAVSILVAPYETNPFRPNGQAVRRPEQTPMYLPANGSWLTAAAMMAAGWDGNTNNAPGFPKSWKVRSEGLLPLP